VSSSQACSSSASSRSTSTSALLPQVTLGQELEGPVEDPHLVAAPGAGPRELALDALVDQPPLQPCHLPVVVEVGLRHPSLHASAGHTPAPVLLRDREPRASGTQDDVGRARRLFVGGRPGQPPEPLDQVLEPVAGDGGDRQAAQRTDRLGRLVHEVGLRPDHELGPLGQRGVVGPQLLAERRQVLRGIGRGEVNHEHERPAPGHVAEEPVAETLPLVGALDEPGDVGHHEALGVHVGDAEVRRERREGVVGDLRLRRGQAGQQRGLPGVREPDQAEVGHRPQLHVEPPLLALLASLGRARRAILRAGEPHVPPAAPPAAGHDGLGPGAHQVRQEPLLVGDDRPVGHRDHEVPSRGAVSPGTAARLAALGALVGVVGEPRQVPEAGIDAEDDVASVSAVATVGTAAGRERLAAHRRGPVAATAGAGPHLALVHEPHATSA
jgi:hypothetical protein